MFFNGNPVADPSAFLQQHENQREPKREELTTWATLVRGRPDRFTALTSLGVSNEVFRANKEVIREGIRRILSTEMKVDGSPGNWSCGFLGSRWFDYTHNGKDVRVAFYSKKHYPTGKEWKFKEPYAITFAIE